jgi:sulfur-carrier protein adenylyltransferase/sulfurtransferase
MKDAGRFPYDLAFDRNVGLITDWEQLALRAKRVAIAGMGGAGGAHLLTLARFGIGAFTIADFDQFDVVNFNRQAGATVANVGRDKCAVMEEMATAINPEIRIRRFDAGVQPETIDAFLPDADLFVDGLDFFAISIRRQVFVRCAELGIPALTAAPIGMGVAFIAFDPKGMSFEQYFRLEGHPEPEQYLRFLIGLTPRAPHRRYLVDPSRIDLERKQGPSTAAACQLCAGVTAVTAVKLLLVGHLPRNMP